MVDSTTTHVRSRVSAAPDATRPLANGPAIGFGTVRRPASTQTRTHTHVVVESTI